MVTKHNMLLVCELHIVDVYDLMNLNGKFNRFDLYLEPKWPLFLKVKYSKQGLFSAHTRVIWGQATLKSAILFTKKICFIRDQFFSLKTCLRGGWGKRNYVHLSFWNLTSGYLEWYRIWSRRYNVFLLLFFQLLVLDLGNFWGCIPSTNNVSTDLPPKTPEQWPKPLLFI